MTESKTIIVCADDFGLNPGVCQGILQLAHSQRLSAVSCLVNMADFSTHARELSDLKNQVLRGLHFNLTEGYLLSEPNILCFSLNELLIKTHAGLIKSSFLAKEFNAQLDRYINEMGSVPDFIDGHQHIHQFPKIRTIILGLYEQRLRAHGTFIRSTYPAITLTPFQFKARILAATGGKVLYARLTQQNIPHNRYFSGVYNFAQGTDYRSLFRQWLSLVPNDTLIMCHPGLGDLNKDSIAHARIVEMDYFASTAFVEDCLENQVTLSTGPKFGENKTINSDES